MSLLGQSQQLFPTSVQVTVHQARNLREKGKNGTNDAYAIIQLAKDKFSTSVAEKCTAPVWKEEASFDLPLFHPGNAERCTLYIIVMHRAQVGLDKFLGQAVINLLELYDDKARKKTQWFKLVDKNGKEDKVRGEVLLDIQFMRNNMSASMFDLSMEDKPRSRISKLKDKVRGKKKDGFSDSASAIVPSVSQVLTDSEEEADAQSLNQSSKTKKKTKLKTLFVPKSNLHRNMSQSMSTLGTLPEKNSSLSGSRSSGLNVDSPEGKKKFKLLGHKRTGSSDSKMSLGPFSLLNRSKQNINDQNSLCINGNHVYTEEPETKSGSTLSLNSSGKGSVEDIRKHTSDIPAESSKTISVPSFKAEPINKASLEQQHHQEEEERRQAEEKRLAEVKRLEQEEKYRAEAKRLQEEEQRKQQEDKERRRRVIEDEARKKKQKEEDERRREAERKMLEAAENQRLEEERRRAEELKRQEEASMSDRLSSLFGMIRKKEEKKEDVQQQAPEEQQHTLAPHTNSGATIQSISHHSTNPFDQSSFTSGTSAVSSESSADNRKFNSNPQAPSATIFLNRTAKVSAVKPRLSQSLESETSDCQTPGQLEPFSVCSESTFTRVPESSEAFSNLHLLLAPPNRSRTGSPWGSTEDLSSVELGRSSSAMADQRRKALLPPSYSGRRTPTEESRAPVRDVKHPAYVEDDGPPQGNKLSLPLPDYESLFSKRRHGVQGQTRWDHIIAEVSQKHKDGEPELMGPEMSVDGPEEKAPSLKSRMPQENPAEKKPKTKPASSKKTSAPAPPKQATSGVDFSQNHRQNVAPQSVMRSSPSVVPPLRKTDSPSSRMFREGDGKEAEPSTETAASHRPQSQKTFDPTPADDRRTVQVPLDKEPPTAKPRQRVGAKDPAQQEQSAVSSSIQALSVVSKTENKTTESIAELEQLPYIERNSKDVPGHLKPNQEDDGLFTGRREKREQKLEQKSEVLMMRKDYLKDFSIDCPADHIDVNDHDSEKQSESRNLEHIPESFSFQRKNSQRTKKNLPGKISTDEKPFMSQQESASNEMANLPSASKDFLAGDVIDGSVTPKSQQEARTQSSYAAKDQYETEVFRGQSAFAYSQPLPVVPEEPESQTGNVSGGKTPLRVWVSPTEAQPVSTQYSNGSGLALTPRRPHPVKPMSSAEIQQPTITPAVKEIKVQSSVPAIMKVADSVSSGPYSQLTQEELITLVVKQQADLSRKDAKINELEQYIDNLLVRVMEEKPAILYSLNTAKQV